MATDQTRNAAQRDGGLDTRRNRWSDRILASSRFEEGDGRRMHSLPTGAVAGPVPPQLARVTGVGTSIGNSGRSALRPQVTQKRHWTSS